MIDWSALADFGKQFFAGMGNMLGGTSQPAPTASYSPNVMGSEEMYGALSPTTPNSGGGGFGSILGEIGKAVLPAAGVAAVGAGAHALFPGEPGKVLATDSRTGTGAQAENTRLQSQGTAFSELQNALRDPYYGTLPADAQKRKLEEIRRGRRASDAARGMLETGGSAKREQTDVQAQQDQWSKERLGTINDRFNQVNAAGTGYQPMSVTTTNGQENPWSKILTTAFAPAAKKGLESLTNKWFV